MIWLLAAVVAVLVAAAVYLLLGRSLMRVVAGFVLLAQAANVIVFAAGTPVPGKAPLVPEGAQGPSEAVADPLPQALILTAIVINLGLIAFAAVLAHDRHLRDRTDDVEEPEE